MKFVRMAVVALCLCALPCSLRPAQAEPVAVTDAGFRLFALGGEVSVFFAEFEAGFDLRLFQVEPVIQGPFFPNHETPVGAAESLGTFDPGTELTFMLDVVSTGDRFFTGPASRNPDGLVHAIGQPFGGDAQIPTPGVLIAFEDLFGGGDFDFNDYRFVVSNAEFKPIPEPGTLLLLGSGGLMAFRSARRARRAPR
jgi:hypothetical protein